MRGKTTVWFSQERGFFMAPLPSPWPENQYLCDYLRGIGLEEMSSWGADDEYIHLPTINVWYPQKDNRESCCVVVDGVNIYDLIFVDNEAELFALRLRLAPLYDLIGEENLTLSKRRFRHDYNHDECYPCSLCESTTESVGRQERDRRWRERQAKKNTDANVPKDEA